MGQNVLCICVKQKKKSYHDIITLLDDACMLTLPSAQIRTITVMFSQFPWQVWCWMFLPLTPSTRSFTAMPVWIPVSSTAQMLSGSTSLRVSSSRLNHSALLVGFADRTWAPSRDDDQIVFIRSEWRRTNCSVQFCPTPPNDGPSRALIIEFVCSRSLVLLKLGSAQL